MDICTAVLGLNVSQFVEKFSFFRAPLTCLISTIQEGDDLAAGAVVVGAEQTAADTAGDAVLLRPLERTCIKKLMIQLLLFAC